MRPLDRELKKVSWDELGYALKLAIKEESFHIRQINQPISYAFNMNTLGDFKFPLISQIKKRPLIRSKLRRRATDFTSKHSLRLHKIRDTLLLHHLYLKNSQTLYGVESTSLAPGYSNIDKYSNQQNIL